MANVYILGRPKAGAARPTDFVVEDYLGKVLATFNTRQVAVNWARGRGHRPLVPRARQLNDKANPDHWRSA